MKEEKPKPNAARALPGWAIVTGAAYLTLNWGNEEAGWMNAEG